MVYVPSEVALDAAVDDLVVLQREHLAAAVQQFLVHLLTRVGLHLGHDFAQLLNNDFFTSDVLRREQADAVDLGLARHELVGLVLHEYFVPVAQRHLRPVVQIRVWLVLLAAQHVLSSGRGILLLDLQVEPRVGQVDQVVFDDDALAAFVQTAGRAVIFLGLLEHTCELLVELADLLVLPERRVVALVFALQLAHGHAQVGLQVRLVVGDQRVVVEPVLHHCRPALGELLFEHSRQYVLAIDTVFSLNSRTDILDYTPVDRLDDFLVLHFGVEYFFDRFFEIRI